MGYTQYTFLTREPVELYPYAVVLHMKKTAKECSKEAASGLSCSLILDLVGTRKLFINLTFVNIRPMPVSLKKRTYFDYKAVPVASLRAVRKLTVMMCN